MTCWLVYEGRALTCTFCASRYCLKKCCGHAWTQQHKVAAAADNRRCHRKLCSFQATINPTASFSLLPQLSRHCQPYRALSSQQSHQQNEKKEPQWRVYLPPTVKKKKNMIHPRKNALLQSAKLHQRWKFAHWSQFQRRLFAVMRPVGCTAKFSWTRLMAAKLAFRSASALVDIFCCSHIIWRSH